MNIIAHEKNRIRVDTWEDIYAVGPLNLNRLTKQANTVLGNELSLDENEFDALDMLAAQEGEPLPFELLYAVVWGTGGDSHERQTAKLILDNLLKQVGEVGKGFMWIEHHPESGYTFRTRWGHNWLEHKHFTGSTKK